jgi:translation initiation factor 5B
LKNFLNFRKKKELAALCKIKILHQYVFRNSNPAIFGVAVEAGKLKPGIVLMDEDGEPVAKVKAIQEQNTQLQEAEQGKEVAMSLPGITFDRQLKDKDYLYSDLGESQFRSFKDNKDLLTIEEMQALQKISQIKRKQNPNWGI